MSAKAKIGLIFLVCAAPIVLGTAAWRFRWGHPASANYGELIPPRALESPAFRALRGKWVLVTSDPAACDPDCERKLYVVRQVRRAQGADAERIERLWLVSDGARPRAELLAAIEGTHLTLLVKANTMDAFPGDKTRSIYLVDPLGNLMMRYPADPEPEKMIRDLERLLKLSRIG